MTAPIQVEYRQRMNDLAATLDEYFNGPEYKTAGRKVFFALLIGEFDKLDDGRINYISNGSRDDMTSALKELLARWEGRYSEAGPTQ